MHVMRRCLFLLCFQGGRTCATRCHVVIPVPSALILSAGSVRRPRHVPRNFTRKGGSQALRVTMVQIFRCRLSANENAMRLRGL